MTRLLIAALLCLHASTAFRILASMVENGFIERQGSGQYQLGAKLLHLGSRVRSSIDVRVEAKSVMEALRDQLDESVNLTVREGDEVSQGQLLVRLDQTRYVSHHLAAMNRMPNKEEKKMAGKFVVHYLRQDGILVLRLVGINSSQLVVAELLAELYSHWRTTRPYVHGRRQDTPDAP